MAKVLTVFKYKLKILFSQKSFLVTMILIPLFLTFITGYALKFEKYSEIPVAICDLDNTDYSKMIIDRIKKKEGFKIIVTNEAGAVDLVKNYKAESAFIIKNGFKDNLISGNIEGIIEQVTSPSSSSHEVIKEIIGSEIARIMLNISAADWVINEYTKLGMFSLYSGSSSGQVEKQRIWDEAWQYTDALWEPEPPMKLELKEFNNGSIVPEEDDSGKDSSGGSISLSAFGMLVAFLAFLIMFNSSWLVEEKENGTLKRIISGPDALTALFVGNILSLLFFGIIQIVIFAAICKLIFKVSIFASASSIIVLFIYLLSITGISLLISCILKTRLQLQAGAPLFAIITGFIGGCFWNITSMGGIVKTISLFTPQGLALDLLGRYGIQPSSEGFLAEAGAILSSFPAIVLILIAVITMSSGYILVKKLRY